MPLKSNFDEGLKIIVIRYEVNIYGHLDKISSEMTIQFQKNLYFAMKKSKNICQKENCVK